MFETNRHRRLLTVAACAASMLLFAACVSAPLAPTASLNEAKLAIKAAEKDDASEFAGSELDEARQKLILADTAVAAENMILAERFAQESIVTARLATARTEASKAVAINDDISRGIDALVDEMQRAGDKP